MARYDYLIVGGGQVSDNAARAIHHLDAHGSIGILSSDVDEPYTRPALSKKLWTDEEFDESQVPLGTAADTGADVRLRTNVSSIDRENKHVVLENGGTVGYGKLLLATGAEPGALAGVDDERVIAFRTFEDYRRLRRLARPQARVVVVGGGYIGAELACALVTVGVSDVTLIFPQERLGASQFPPQIVERYEALFTDGGVRLLPGRTAQRVAGAVGEDLTVVLDDGTRLTADVVVAGLGAAPRLDLAEQAGLEVDDRGVVVDEHLVTSDPFVWAAGDIVSYPDAILGRHQIAHVDHARASGDAAGRSMAGEATYDHTPFFYSQVFGTRWEAVGALDSSLETLVVDLDDERTVVYYLENSRPAGVLLWRVEDATDQARHVLREASTDRDALRGAIR